MTELTSIQLRTGRILSTRNMITEFGLESIGYPLQSSGWQPAPAMRTPDTSPRHEAAGTYTAGVGLEVELTTEHPTRSVATDETIEVPEAVHRPRADDQLIIEPAHPSRSDGYPTPTPPDPQLPSLATVPMLASDDTNEVERVPTASQWVRAQGRRQATSQVPPRLPRIERRAVADGAAPVPHTIPRRADGEQDAPLPPVVPERSEVRGSRLLARTPAFGHPSPTERGVRGEGQNAVDSRSNHGEPPASNPLSTTSSPLDNLSALPMADTAVQGAPGRMSGKRRRELAQIESAVQHSRQRELRIDSGR